MEITNKYETVSLGETNTTTMLSDLFTMLAVKRLGGRASWHDISKELQRFGIEIKAESIRKKAVERATELFDVSDDQISLKELGAGLQLTFLSDVIRVLSVKGSEPEPPWFHHALNRISKCTWTPKGFTAEVKKRHVRIIKKRRPNDSSVSDEQSLFTQSDQEPGEGEAPQTQEAPHLTPTSGE